MKKTFTLGEVQTLLPVLEALMLRAREDGMRAAALESEMDQLRQRIFLQGGTHVDVALVAQQRSAQNSAVEAAKATLAEIEEIGATVHDLEEGLLDLPYRVDGREVLLCWKLSEPTVTHWHEVADEPAERLRLDEHFGRDGRERLN